MSPVERVPPGAGSLPRPFFDEVSYGVADSGEPLRRFVLKAVASVLLMVSASVPAFAGETTSGASDGSWSALDGVPRWALSVFQDADFVESYQISTRLNPFLVSGDFDGDGRLDLAALIERKGSGEDGIVFVHAGDKRSFIVGAGQRFGNGGTDFTWVGTWYAFPKRPVGETHDSGPPPELLGDALLVAAPESASALLYWDGAGYRWYQQGD